MRRIIFTDKEMRLLADFFSLLIKIDRRLKVKAKNKRSVLVKQQKVKDVRNSPKESWTGKGSLKPVQDFLYILEFFTVFIIFKLSMQIKQKCPKFYPERSTCLIQLFCF